MCVPIIYIGWATHIAYPGEVALIHERVAPGVYDVFVVKTLLPWVASRANVLYIAPMYV